MTPVGIPTSSATTIAPWLPNIGSDPSSASPSSDSDGSQRDAASTGITATNTTATGTKSHHAGKHAASDASGASATQGTGSPAAAAGTSSADKSDSDATKNDAAELASIVAARQALLSANSDLELDQRNHSPTCVATDQKYVAKAEIGLAQAEKQALNAGLPPAVLFYFAA